MKFTSILWNLISVVVAVVLFMFKVPAPGILILAGAVAVAVNMMRRKSPDFKLSYCFIEVVGIMVFTIIREVLE